MSERRPISGRQYMANCAATTYSDSRKTAQENYAEGFKKGFEKAIYLSSGFPGELSPKLKNLKILIEAIGTAEVDPVSGARIGVDL